MDECDFCFAQNNMRALCNVFMRIEPFWCLMELQFAPNINLWWGMQLQIQQFVFYVWCVAKCEYHSMHLHFIYNHYP
jgi:hypothetical protein